MLRREYPARYRWHAPSRFPLDYGDLRQSRRAYAAADSAAMAGGEGMLTQEVQAYLAVRRAMGFGMKWSGNLLRGFAAFSNATGQHHVCSDTAIKWAGSTPSVRTRARRLGLVIRLALYLRAEDQRHEVPPPVFGSEDRTRRPAPYIYSKETCNALSKPRARSGGTPTPSIAGLQTAHSSDCWHALECGCRKRLISGCKRSPQMVFSFEILNSARAV
jgi:hypothetical protein